jgi:hypothetical protein
MTLPVRHKKNIQAICKRLEALYDKYRKNSDRKTKMGWGAVVSILIILAYIFNYQSMTDFSGTLGLNAALGGIIVFGVLWHGSRREVMQLVPRLEDLSYSFKDIGVVLSWDGKHAYLRNEDGSLGSGFDPFNETSFE